MGSGCGTFILYGYDMYGIDPSLWKFNFNEMKDNFFDCVSTYQTLKHIQNLDRVLKEMIRVTKSGGGIHIKCSDYISTFEGHYLIPWFPLFPKRFARVYLRILKKPINSLDTL